MTGSRNTSQSDARMVAMAKPKLAANPNPSVRAPWVAGATLDASGARAMTDMLRAPSAAGEMLTT